MPPEALTPLAVQNAEILRALAADPRPVSIAALARDLGRDQANLRKTLTRLGDDGLVGPAPLLLQLTDAGQRALALLSGQPDQAPPLTAGIAPAGYALLHPIQIRIGALNPRKHFDEDAIAELAESIARDGLLENLVVRALPDSTVDHHVSGIRHELPLYELIAGERRYRAIMLLARDGRWPEGQPILCKVTDLDEAGHRRVALVENLQRKDLRPIDEAQALRDLMQVTGQGTAEVAQEIGFTQRFVQQRLQLLNLPAPMLERLNAGELTIEDGGTAATIWPKLPPIKQVELREGKTSVADAKAWLAQQADPHDFPPDELLILLEIAWLIAKGSNGYWTSVPCSYQLPALPRAMETAGWIRFDQRNYGEDAGKMQVKLTNDGWNQVVAMTGSPHGALKREGIEPLLRQARTRVIGGSPLSADYDPAAHLKVDTLFREKRSALDWLNGPFKADPAVLAEIEAARKARESDHRPVEDEWERQRAEREAARAKALELAHEALADLAAGDDVRAVTVRQICKLAGYPLPWRVAAEPYERLVDAEGDTVRMQDARGLMALVVGIMNNAGDVEPEPDQVDVEDAIAAQAEAVA